MNIPRLKINKNRNSEKCEKSDDLSEKRHCDVSKAYQYIEKKVLVLVYSAF
jgi:hypothetical protein